MSRTDNRSAMPVVASIVDDIRAMGIDVKVVYASENGVVMDKREPVKPEQVFRIPRNYNKPMGGWPKEGK